MMTVGDVVVRRKLITVSGEPVVVPDPDQLVHLQFRRFAGCPICNMHLRSIMVRHSEITAAGIREVVVFHSTEQELRQYEPDLPFAVIADPGKELYAEFGVGASRTAVLNPAVLAHVPAIGWNFVRGIITGRRRLPPRNPTGGQLGRPADLLIAPDGRVIAAKYGEHAYDQWAVDELLTHARPAP
jgi:hypothetical protein